jgi:hypothetical protein
VLVAASCLALAGCGGSDTPPAEESAEPAPPLGATACYADERGNVDDCPAAPGSFKSHAVTNAEARRQEERFDDQVARLENELDEPYGLDDS